MASLFYTNYCFSVWLNTNSMSVNQPNRTCYPLKRPRWRSDALFLSPENSDRQHNPTASQCRRWPSRVLFHIHSTNPRTVTKLPSVQKKRMHITNHSMKSAIECFPDPHRGLLLGDIFSGIGGWELAAGHEWKCTFAAEMEPCARRVWTANFGREPDVCNILDSSPLSAKFAHVYCVSFPCQSSSQAGKRLGRRDPRGGLVLARALEFLNFARPPLIIFENVKGFKSVERGSYHKWLLKKLHIIGYPVVKESVLMTADFGLPQRRSRLYLSLIHI